jgi:hypothetical protein
MATVEIPRVRRPVEDGDWNLAYLFPDEVVEARLRTGMIFLPIAPIEWHGPHLAMGCDNLLAHAFARRLGRAIHPVLVDLGQGLRAIIRSFVPRRRSL